ncbi:non-ribosomal peptide synthetase [Gemmobacter denitrificans]|uniref:Amino acid adenylation domain-containing protein n=1 Tax=Gemmobacter denitrificans TaxID=3123040 RepID=A0ABU8BZ40_9RHOB
MTAAELFHHLKTLGLDLSVDDGDLILEGPVEQLDEAVITDLRAQKSALISLVEAQHIRPRATLAQDCPMSFQQQRLWFLDQLAPGEAAYNIAAAYRLRGAVETERFQAVLDRVVARHAALRTSFVVLPEGPVQRISAQARVSLELHDLRPLGAARHEAARKIAAEHATRGFDLTDAPLFRAALIRLAADDFVLAINMHHIISDGWSIGVLLRDVVQAYAGLDLAPARLDYGDYAIWQRGPGGAVQAADEAYWQAVLADLPGLSTLPPDHPRPALPDHAGARETLSLDAALVARLRRRAAQQGGTLYMLLLAGFGLVLARHLRQTDLCIGSPVANRTRPGLDEMIGFFVNMLPLRIAPQPDLTLAAYLEQVRDRVLAGFAHQDLPFERLVERLGVERQLSHAPLFQTVLVLQDAGTGPIDLPGLEVEALPPETVAAKFDLTLTLAETGEGGLVGDLTYASALYDPARMGRVAGHFANMLHAIAAADPQTRLADLPMLALPEQVLLQGALSQGQVRPAMRDLAARVATLATEAPEAPAVTCGTDHLTRAELNRNADALALRLQQAGLVPGEIVGIYATASVMRVVAMLAVLRAGGAWLPLDMAYPAQRLAMMAEDARPRLILAEGALPFVPTCPVLDLMAPCPQGTPHTAPPHPEAPAYVIFTSGSTGRPKGVIVPHRGLENLCHWLIGMFTPGPGQRISALARFGFDGSVLECWMALVSGAELVLAPEAVLADPARLLEWWASQRLQIGFLPTPLAELAMQGNEVPEGLTWLLTGGDRLRQTPPAGAGYRLANLYGPTEASSVVTAGAIAAQDSPPPIGTPIDNTGIHLLDSALNRVPIGAIGELYIAGPSLAQAYAGRPDLTAEAFLPDPFGPPGARMYRSGDLARLQSDGRLAYLGRADAQISLRGYRIEPAEVERALQDLTANAPCLVLERGGRLLAYVQTAASLDAGALLERLAQRLPDYMLPAAVLTLRDWPLTANGKLDRAALPVPDHETTEFEPPQGQVETELAKIWQAVLGLDRPVGRHDSFFALGGHSLLATQAMARIRAVFGTDLPLRLMFETRSLASLAREIAAAGPTNVQALPPLLPREAGHGPDLPLSFAQQRLWFLDQLEPGNPFYSIPAALRLKGRLNETALEGTLEALVRRHESLRTTFPMQAGSPVQRIATDMAIPLVRRDLTGLPSDQIEAEATRLSLEEAHRPFDLGRGPLLRVSLLQLGDEDALLLFNMHHIISDGWSMGVLIAEVAALYGAMLRQEPDPLPALTVQYGDFALWQRNWLTGARLKEAEDFWLAQLGGLPPVPVQLPTDRPRPAAQSHRGATHSLDLDAETTVGLRRLAARHGATLFMVLNAAYAALLARHSGQSDIVIGTPIANRRVPALEALVGFFVNTLVLRHQVEISEPFSALLNRVRQTALAAYDHQDLPFEHLVDLLNPTRDLAHAPIFQVAMALQNMPRQALDLPGLTLTTSRAEAVTAKFDLSLTLFETGDHLHCDAEYATDLFDAATIARLCADFVRLLRAIVANPDQPLHLLSPPDAAELDQLAAWNRTAGPIAAPSVIDAFRARAAAHPHAPALIWQDQRMNYGELDRASNRLAHALRAAGVRPGMLVGLGTGRGIAHICGGLAILKAGACFVMLPMDAPAERLAYVLADAGLDHVIGSASGPWPERIKVIDPEGRGFPETPLPPFARVDRAYVVYTSGTTGQPKGSINTQSGLANFCDWWGRMLELAPGRTVSAVSNVAFDGNICEIWPTLTHGATLVIVPEDTLRDPWLLSDLLARHQVDTVYLPMGYLDAIAKSGFDWPASLRHVLAGGDRMKGYLLPRDPGLPLTNVYGPSETQTVSTAFTLGPDHQGPVPIGRPLPNTRVYVLDAMLNPLPLGAVGEICIAGQGVGEGYLGRPGLTADRFRPDPFGPPGSRMYCSGDMGRFLPDGNLDFVGRQDGQLKIRGFRVELAEVERALLDQDCLAEAVVIAESDPKAGQRLLAYVVPRPGMGATHSHWQSTFEQIYAHEDATGESPAEFDITGWTDSYSGAPIPAPEMAEWLEETIARIAALAPGRVLEVGCGTGMILHRIAPMVQSYAATDLSQIVLERLSRSLGPGARHVDLYHCPADDWTRLAGRRFDTVILNSVAQYFPSLDYLEQWLAAAVAHVDSGTIFLGDIRNLTLAEPFALSVIDHGADADATLAGLRGQVARHLAMEPELLVDPAWFFAMAAQDPRITGLRVRPKLGRAVNELTRFRYDVELTIGRPAPERSPETWRPFTDLKDLETQLAQGAARVALRDIPDQRLAPMQALLQALRSLPDSATRSQLHAHAAGLSFGVDLHDLMDLAARHGCQIDFCLGGSGLNAVLWRNGAPPDWTSLYRQAPRPAARHGNLPYQPERNTALVEQLTEALATRLPAYMLPWHITVMARLPLTSNGKVDRRGLPFVERGVEGSGDELLGVAAGVAGIWGEVLGLAPGSLGGEANFFALGGHSLLATQVISRIRAGFGVELPLRALFEHPTLRALAAEVEALMTSGEAVLPAPQALRHPPGTALPLSFAQQRLWFLDQLSPGDPAYSLPIALRLEGALDPAALAAALTWIVARHAVLRSRFVLQAGAPVQVALPPGPVDLPVIDLSALPEPARDTALMQAVQDEAATPFDLTSGAPLRTRLIRLGPDHHVVALNMHHIVSDGWSMGVLLREMAAAYTAFATGTAPDLPDLPLDYADYAVWQRDWLQGPVQARQLAYWQRHLQGLPGLLALPTDHPRPPVQSHRGAALTLQLEAPLVQALQDLGRSANATLHMVLTGVLAVLLSRWSGQDDLAIGTPVAGRRHAALEGLIGFFVNTLVMRCQVDPAADFATLLARLRDEALAGQAHQDLPFEQLVEALAPARDLSHAPLFQVMLALQNAPLGEMGFGGLRLAPMGFETRHAKFDITLSLQEDPTGTEGVRPLIGTLEYAADLFEPATMARFAEQFLHLARAVAGGAAGPVAALPLMDAESRARKVQAWAARPAPEGTRQGATLAALFEATVARSPDRIALRHEGHSISYDALNRRANRLAHRLIAQGAGPDQIIGICTERSPEMIVAILAILKAGAAYLTLDPDHPDDRIRYMITDAKPRAVITTRNLIPRLQNLGIPDHQILIPDAKTTGANTDTNPEQKTNPDTLAYVIYTSGSTGKPKGTMVAQSAVLRLFDTTQPGFAFGPEDVWTLFHSYAFDFSVWEIFGALLHGGALVIVPWLTSRDPEAFHRLLLEEGVTVLNQTPSAFAQLAAHRLAQPEAGKLALKWVIFGGEALNPAGLTPWFEAHGDQMPQLVNMYGITETTVHVTWQRLHHPLQAIGSIGQPIPDLQVRLLDAAMEPLPIGVPGEMFVAGPGLARGYLNRPALTAERFVPDPYGPPGTRLYRSGDLARELADGRLDYQGRADQQVKIRGFRIETGEIEAALTALPLVRAAVVLARDGRLVAWHCSPLSEAELRAALATRLPDYMVPAGFVALEALPLTANGKVDRAALPEPQAAAMPDHVAPRTPREAALSALWSEVLGRDRIGIHDNFFASGGDSMRAVTLSARAREQGISLSLASLFRHQTIAALVQADEGETAALPQPPLSEGDRAQMPEGAEALWPMTRLQLGMAFHAEADSAAAVYHDVFSFRLRLPWDEASFRQALALIVARHPILRTRFDLMRFSRPMQVVQRSAEVPLQITDLSTLPAPVQRALLAEAIAAEKARPIPLDLAPLVRVAVHLLGPEELEITLGLHHAILDGWSVASLQVELLSVWAQLRRGEQVALPPLASDFAASIAAEMQAVAAPAQRAFWADRLAGQSPLVLPPPRQTDAPFAPISITVDHGLQMRLRSLADRLGLPLRSLLLAVHMQMLAQWAATRDVTTGLVSHMRTEAPDAEKVLGLFLNTLPLRMHLVPESWQTMIRRLFASELELMRHRFYPLAQIVEDRGHLPLFDVIFNFIDFHVLSLVAPGESGVQDVTSFEATNFALVVNAIAQGGQLVMNFAADPRRMDADTVRRMADTYLRGLQHLADDPEALANMALLPEDQARLRAWNETSRPDLDPGETLTARIEACVAAHPEAIAIECADETLSFAALNAKANRLAHHLRGLGAGVDRVVGLCTNRSVEMIVAILAILKAGSAWLPLPPDAPAERLAMMIEDAQPVLTLIGPGAEGIDLPGEVLSLAAPISGPDSNPAAQAGAEALAYVLFTSGSTGRPKGVGVAHRAIVNRLLWMAEAYDIGPADTVAQKTPYGFDVSVWELILPLMTGARMVIARPGGHLDPAYMADLIRSRAITVAHFVPPMLDVFLAVTNPADSASLRAVICSGQALTRATQDRFHAALPGCGLHNLYGPTEAAVDVTAFTCRPEDSGQTVPIGRAIANVQMHVLDEALNPLPPGVAGHLFIGGIALARGYVNRPDLTAASFVPDPFGPPGSRLYRTGDLARFLPDGTIDYLGRADDQVKIRGMRVELGEVEAALLANGAAEAVVMARPDPAGEAMLVAWLTGWDGDAIALRARLARRLPDQMIPAHLVALPALPLNANGKVDRRALPDPTPPDTPFLPPRTETERMLARIWADLLQVDQVGRDVSFFALGGHSLNVLRMLARVQRDCGVVISLRTFLAAPDIASLAQAVEGIRDSLTPDLDLSETEMILL